jgi:hypothetical protein
VKPYQPLADARRRLRLGLPSPELATPEAPAAERPSVQPVPSHWPVPVATQDPRDRATRRRDALRRVFEELLVQAGPSDLDRLLGMLQMHLRRTESR